MEAKEGLNSELDSFRQQWLSDLRTRQGHEASTQDSRQDETSSRNAARTQKREPPAPSLAGGRHVPPDDEDYIQSRTFDEPAAPSGRTLAGPESEPAKELVSALDHYEEAMEKEGQGNMGESLTLYRRAYRLDNRVDRRYREKHFPAGAPAPAAQPSVAASTALAPKAEGDPKAQPRSIFELITSFSDLRIEGTPAEIDGAPRPPCPIADLPGELLVHILHDVAVEDVGDFARLASVCRHFAYLAATEQRIWRRVCLGSEVGFGGMHYHWQRAVEWDALEEEDHDVDGTIVSMRELAERRRGESSLVTKSLIPSAYPTWQAMFRSRPRIRFNGCYISTVNYVRTGQASTNQSTWGGTPIHIVTYYRYLRFFRDGTAISLLTSAEPGDVVHHLTRDLLKLHREAPHAHLPSAVMQHSLKGRWRLSSSALEEDDADGERGELQEGDLYVETEGVGSKYMYRMNLTMRSAGKGSARNNKIAWKGFYSYNKLTDDWAEFGLKNYKPFFFSRVKSYRSGE